MSQDNKSFTAHIKPNHQPKGGGEPLWLKSCVSAWTKFMDRIVDFVTKEDLGDLAELTYDDFRQVELAYQNYRSAWVCATKPGDDVKLCDPGLAKAMARDFSGRTDDFRKAHYPKCLKRDGVTEEWEDFAERVGMTEHSAMALVHYWRLQSKWHKRAPGYRARKLERMTDDQKAREREGSKSRMAKMRATPEYKARQLEKKLAKTCHLKVAS